jgi:hypothetical protein
VDTGLFAKSFEHDLYPTLIKPKAIMVSEPSPYHAIAGWSFSELTPLTKHYHCAFIPVEITGFDIGSFRQPTARVPKEVEDCLVSITITHADQGLKLFFEIAGRSLLCRFGVSTRVIGL